jgi:ABC-type bacteriocin/lantibiotic exporter with double-glycine peptidase domain
MVNQELPRSCGAACVRQLGLDIGKDVPESKIRTASKFTPERGINEEHLGEAATRLLGVLYQGGADGGALTPEQLVRAASKRGPWIARVKPGPHYLIVDAVTEEGVCVRDPWGEAGPGSGAGTEGVILLEDFLDCWQAGNYRWIIKGVTK